MGPAQNRRGGAREDGQAGQLGRSPSRLERRRGEETGGGRGIGRHGEIGTEEGTEGEKGDSGRTEKWAPQFPLR